MPERFPTGAIITTLIGNLISSLRITAIVLFIIIFGGCASDFSTPEKKRGNPAHAAWQSEWKPEKEKNIDKCSERTLEELEDWDITIDEDCFIQWSEALKKGNFSPEDSLDGDVPINKEDIIQEDSIIIFQSDSSAGEVIFSHSIHTYWLECSACHYGSRRIFIPRKGANSITMKKILEGEYCGVCHGPSGKSDSFMVRDGACDQCHVTSISKKTWQHR